MGALGIHKWNKRKSRIFPILLFNAKLSIQTSVRKGRESTGTDPTAKSIVGTAKGGRVLVETLRGVKRNEGKSLAKSGAKIRDLTREGGMSVTREEMSTVRRGERMRMKSVGKTTKRGKVMRSDGKRGLMMTTEHRVIPRMLTLCEHEG